MDISLRGRQIMAEKIIWTLNVQVAGGPKVSTSQTVEVEAYEKIDTVIPQKGPKGNPVSVQRAPQDSMVSFLLITSDQYNDNLSYKYNGQEIKLNAPQLFIGDSATTLFNKMSGKIEITNNLDKDISINILVGRTAKIENPSNSSSADNKKR